MHGFEAIPRILADHGASVVFSMLGGTNVAWIGAGVRAGILRLVKTRHECTAVTAAMGYARAGGGVGLCSVTRGPGFTNALTALTAAARTHVPIVLLVAESPSADPDNVQNIDQRALTQITGAAYRHIGQAADLAAQLGGAVREVRRAGRPCVVSIADAVLHQAVDFDLPAAAPDRGAPVDAAAVAAAADMLAGARQPLILAGQGAVIADCGPALRRLADRLGARLATTMFANRCFSGHPADLGLCGGYALPEARRHFAECDVVLAVGASLNAYTVGQGKLFRAARIIHCDIDPAAIGARTPADLALSGDARETVALLAEAVAHRVPAPARPRFAEPVIGRIRDSAHALDLGNRAADGLDPRQVYRWLDGALPADRVIVTDGGRTLPLLPSLVDAPDARSFLVGWGFGSIGLGLGTAIGAAVARPDSAVTLVAGDGGFMMAAEDLDAVRLAGLDLTVVVMNDRQYGAELRHLAHYGLPPDIARQDPPDLVALARVFGGDGAVIADEAGLAAHGFAGRKGLWILDIRITRDADAKTAFGVTRPAAAPAHA